MREAITGEKQGGGADRGKEGWRDRFDQSDLDVQEGERGKEKNCGERERGD